MTALAGTTVGGAVRSEGCGGVGGEGRKLTAESWDLMAVGAAYLCVKFNQTHQW